MTQLTVKELILLLQRENPDAKVDLEGCDCIGPAAGVEHDLESVLIKRG